MDWILIRRWRIDDYFLHKGDIISFEYVVDTGRCVIVDMNAVFQGRRVNRVSS